VRGEPNALPEGLQRLSGLVQFTEGEAFSIPRWDEMCISGEGFLVGVQRLLGLVQVSEGIAFASPRWDEVCISGEGLFKAIKGSSKIALNVQPSSLLKQ
jgi:hypothetical protein